MISNTGSAMAATRAACPGSTRSRGSCTEAAVEVSPINPDFGNKKERVPGGPTLTKPIAYSIVMRCLIDGVNIAISRVLARHYAPGWGPPGLTVPSDSPSKLHFWLPKVADFEGFLLMFAATSLIPELEDVLQNGSREKRADALKRITSFFIHRGPGLTAAHTPPLHRHV